MKYARYVCCAATKTPSIFFSFPVEKEILFGNNI